MVCVDSQSLLMQLEFAILGHTGGRGAVYLFNVLVDSSIHVNTGTAQFDITSLC